VATPILDRPNRAAGCELYINDDGTTTVALPAA
jgi:hypothetical protein